MKEMNKKKKKTQRKKSKDEEVKITEKPKTEGIEKKDHGGARPKTAQTVPVPFNTRTRSA